MWWESILLQSWVVTVLYADVCTDVCTEVFTGCGIFLGGYVLCIRISTDDIKGFLTQMIDPLSALSTPCWGPKTKTFCYIICNSWLTLWHHTLRKYQVKEGTGWQWRLLLQDGGQRSWLLVWVVPKSQNVDLSIIMDNYIQIIQENLACPTIGQNKFLVIFWVWKWTSQPSRFVFQHYDFHH